MRRFKVEVEVIKCFVVEVDDEMVTDEDIEDWESVFYPLDEEDDKISSLVHDYCETRARLGNIFIEGYGKVLKVGQKADGYFVKDSEVCKFMKMVECDDDGYTDVNLKELWIDKKEEK